MVALACLAVLHLWIFAVDIAYDARVYESMVERCVEDCLLLLCATLDAYASKVAVPLLDGLCMYCVKILAFLLGIQVLPCILNRNERDTHLHGNLLALGKVVIAKTVTYVVAGNLAVILLVELVCAVIGGPLGLYAGERRLELPCTFACWSL